ncbi:hypothetical protein CYMTET_13508 [Cymbomonas tetramitiformis]|uniref:Single-stranded DNA-binding protein n=1 Tax=Cymbomonas tetramitiformis TaxID=36881 RepID=A0AAE0GI98_9CHLO|nr:hypothetical protein CYMTET_13508 [Cymbomonas tetramitiformis]
MKTATPLCEARSVAPSKRAVTTFARGNQSLGIPRNFGRDSAVPSTVFLLSRVNSHPRPAARLRTYANYEYEYDTGSNSVSSSAPKEVEWDQSIANSVHLIGHAGRDPEVKVLQSGNMVASLTLAVSNGKDKPPDWHTLEFWGEEAQMARDHVFKGSRLHVAGRLKVDTWQDKMTGQGRSKVKIVVNNIELIKYTGNSTPGNSAPDEPSSGTAPGPANNAVPVQGGDKWSNFFLQPAAFWDNREGKRNPKAPDFKHKDTNEPLWINSYDTPSWVAEKLREMDEKRREMDEKREQVEGKSQQAGGSTGEGGQTNTSFDMDPPF